MSQERHSLLQKYFQFFPGRKANSHLGFSLQCLFLIPGTSTVTRFKNNFYRLNCSKILRYILWKTSVEILSEELILNEAHWVLSLLWSMGMSGEGQHAAQRLWTSHLPFHIMIDSWWKLEVSGLCGADRNGLWLSEALHKSLLFYRFLETLQWSVLRKVILYKNPIVRARVPCSGQGGYEEPHNNLGQCHSYLDYPPQPRGKTLVQKMPCDMSGCVT